ncbi:MAG: Zn-ribbon domain-containing OB-fold protein [Dehalococcoidia bacterium]
MTSGNSVPNIQTTEGQAQLKAMGIKPVPVPDEVTQAYWDGAKQHKLVLQYCNACSDYQHPPHSVCRVCGGSDLASKEVSGKGTIYSFIIDRRLMTPGFDEPYAVIQVNPVEAKRDTVRITTNMRDCGLEDIKMGMPVEVVFEEVKDGVVLPQFRPAK